MTEILVFSKPSCVPCSSTKEWLQQKNISYTEIPAFDKPDMPVKYRVRSLPTTILLESGKESGRVVGFKPEELLKLLGIGNAT